MFPNETRLLLTCSDMAAKVRKARSRRTLISIDHIKSRQTDLVLCCRVMAI